MKNFKPKKTKITKTVTQFGKISKLEKVLQSFTQNSYDKVKEMYEEKFEEAKQLALDFKKDLQKKIISQDFANKKLNPKYKAKKIKQGYDPRTLIKTRDYLENGIFIDIDMSMGNRSIKIIPNKEKTKSNPEITYSDLANWLEYGTIHMPPRPHWQPLKAVYKKKAQALLKKWKRKEGI